MKTCATHKQGANSYFEKLVRPVWSNYSPAGRVWPATAFSVAHGSIQEKPSNTKFVEKRVRLHLSVELLVLDKAHLRKNNK